MRSREPKLLLLRRIRFRFSFIPTFCLPRGREVLQGHSKRQLFQKDLRALSRPLFDERSGRVITALVRLLPPLPAFGVWYLSSPAESPPLQKNPFPKENLSPKESDAAPGSRSNSITSCRLPKGDLRPSRTSGACAEPTMLGSRFRLME